MRIDKIQDTRVKVEVLQLKNIQILKRALVDVEKQITSNTSFSAFSSITSNSDIIPEKYEGGLKTWECATDLVEYLSEDSDLSGQRVLELGCGSGLPGVYCLQRGSSVTFQDFNSEVIELTTIPNAILSKNTSVQNNEVEISNEDLDSLNAAFYAGDWDQVSSELNGSFDLILTSETIYNPQNYDKLVNAMKRLIKPQGRM